MNGRTGAVVSHLPKGPDAGSMVIRHPYQGSL